MIYVISKTLIDYWNNRGVSVSTRQAFLSSMKLGIKSLHSGKRYEFGANCAYVWENGNPKTLSWDTFEKDFKNIKFIEILVYAFNRWERDMASKEADKLNVMKEKLIKQDKENVDRLQKQNPEITGGTLPKGSRIKGITRKASVGIGHLSYNSVKA